MGSHASTPIVAALGAGALLGAVLGALLGTLVLGARPRELAAPSVPAGANPAFPQAGPQNERVELLLATLIDEVRALRTSLTSTRQVAAGDDQPDASGDSSIELLAALQALTSAVRAGGGAGLGGPGRGLPVIDFPSGGPRFDLIQPLLEIEDESQRVRPFLLWNYQQVLDRFGPPTAIYDGERWTYEDPARGPDLTLRFQHGLLTSID